MEDVTVNESQFTKARVSGRVSVDEGQDPDEVAENVALREFREQTDSSGLGQLGQEIRCDVTPGHFQDQEIVRFDCLAVDTYL